MSIKASISKKTVKKILCIFFSFGLFLISLCILTVISYYSNMDYELIRVLSYVLLCVFLFLASFLVAYMSESAGWLNGIIAAFVYLVFVLLTALAINGTDCNIKGFLMKVPLYLLGGAISGVIAVNLHK